MRLSPNRFGAAAAAVAALVLAACAGHSALPSTAYLAPGTGVDAKKPTPSPCTLKQQPWLFGGACGTVTLSTKGGTASMPLYKGFTIKAAFSSGAPAGTVLLVRDATGKGDITGTVAGKKFPSFDIDGLKPLLYLKARNDGVAFTFSGIPQITITSTTGYPGTRCLLTKMLSTGAWETSPLLNGQITGKTLEFGKVAAPQPIPKGGTIYIAVACH